MRVQRPIWVWAFLPIGLVLASLAFPDHPPVPQGYSLGDGSTNEVKSLGAFARILAGCQGAGCPRYLPPVFLRGGGNSLLSLKAMIATQTTTDPSLNHSSSRVGTPSDSEMSALAELFFEHMLPMQQQQLLKRPQPSSSSSPSVAGPTVASEMGTPEAASMTRVLHKLWRAAMHKHEATGSNVTSCILFPSSHNIFSFQAGGQTHILMQLVEAARRLASLSCRGERGRMRQLGMVEAEAQLPFTLLRRVTMSVLHVTMTRFKNNTICLPKIEKATNIVLTSFARALSCSRASRTAFEFLHVSKSGGTSMCRLARITGHLTPAIDSGTNCMSGSHDRPIWTREEIGMRGKVEGSTSPRSLMAVGSLFPAISTRCPRFERQITCKDRARKLTASNYTFYANERALHGGTDVPGSAGACKEMETVIVLREAATRAQSHVRETNLIYERRYNSSHEPALLRSRDLMEWRQWAPAVLDNFLARYLLGRHFLCRDFGALQEAELLGAALTLTSIDHVLVLGDDHLNNVTMKAALGWMLTLAEKKARSGESKDLHSDLGFPPDFMQELTASNQIDTLLVVLGSLYLRLDVAFHASVAFLTGRVAREKETLPKGGSLIASLAAFVGGPRLGKPLCQNSEQSHAWDDEPSSRHPPSPLHVSMVLFPSLLNDTELVQACPGKGGYFGKLYGSYFMRPACSCNLYTDRKNGGASRTINTPHQIQPRNNLYC